VSVGGAGAWIPAGPAPDRVIRVVFGVGGSFGRIRAGGGPVLAWPGRSDRGVADRRSERGRDGKRRL